MNVWGFDFYMVLMFVDFVASSHVRQVPARIRSSVPNFQRKQMRPKIVETAAGWLLLSLFYIASFAQ